MRSAETEILVRIDADGHATENEQVTDLVMSAVQNVVDATGKAFSLQRKRHAELFRASLLDLLSTREAQASTGLLQWFAARGLQA